MKNILYAVRHPLRQVILEHLRVPTTVTDLYTKLRKDQPTVSMHLKVLRNAGVVETTRDGKFIHYQVVPDLQARIDEASKVNGRVVEVTDAWKYLRAETKGKNRKIILAFVRANPGKTVNEICTGTGFVQSVTSNELRILREAGVVFGEKDGRFVRYTAIA